MVRLIRSGLSFALLLALLLTALSVPAEAQMRGPGRKGMGRQPSVETEGSQGGGPGFVERREGELKPTGLVPAFPEDHVCAPIASPFASPFRYDGSSRRDDRFGGLHGGIDLTLEEGTPLLAVAGGKVIAKGTGGQLEGIYLWLMHAPSDTGLPFWVYTKYQHLSALPALNEGDTVHVGQVVASSGKTGTVGGHYGPAGYPHLHLTAVAGPSGEYMRVGMYGSMIRARDATLSDPLILYLTEPGDPASVASLPEDRKRVRIPVVSNDGTIHPPGRKVVWPVACKRTGTK
jgi:murein DD-endopeptidase MepM/ murein hydrolase activator NlpD